MIGEASAKVLSKGVTTYFGSLTKKQQKAFLSGIGKITNAQLREIRKEVASGVTPKVLESSTEKYGYDVIVSAFMSSVSVEFVK